MISAGVKGRLPYMTYPEPWGGPPKQPPEFLRPAPKPHPQARYNGMAITSALNGGRQQRPNVKYSPPPSAPVNLTQHKEETADDLQYPAYTRLYTHQAPPPPPPFTFHSGGPYANLFQTAPYTQTLLRPTFQPPPPSLSTLDTVIYPSATSSGGGACNATFLPVTTVYGTPEVVLERKPSPNFKVPTGKEGSLKHRILTRPGESLPLPPRSHHPEKSEVLVARKTTTHGAIVSPPRSPAKSSTITSSTTNNNVVPVGSFTKGSVVQLFNGELKKVEDMRTEDFVNSAERNPELRLADSTVVRIEENPITGTAIVTLSYNQRQMQVEFEVALEHPFFVYGQGWASCAPDRTRQAYALKVHRLQVGDILISLTPREPAITATTASGRTATIITTATTTAVTARQVPTNHLYHAATTASSLQPPPSPHQPLHRSSLPPHELPPPPPPPPRPLSPDGGAAARKRRWSAPDQICDDDEHAPRRIKT